MLVDTNNADSIAVQKNVKAGWLDRRTLKTEQELSLRCVRKDSVST